MTVIQSRGNTLVEYYFLELLFVASQYGERQMFLENKLNCCKVLSPFFLDSLNASNLSSVWKFAADLSVLQLTEWE